MLAGIEGKNRIGWDHLGSLRRHVPLAHPPTSTNSNELTPLKSAALSCKTILCPRSQMCEAFLLAKVSFRVHPTHSANFLIPDFVDNSSVGIFLLPPLDVTVA